MCWESESHNNGLNIGRQICPLWPSGDWERTAFPSTLHFIPLRLLMVSLTRGQTDPKDCSGHGVRVTLTFYKGPAPQRLQWREHLSPCQRSHANTLFGSRSHSTLFLLFPDWAADPVYRAVIQARLFPIPAWKFSQCLSKRCDNAGQLANWYLAKQIWTNWNNNGKV